MQAGARALADRVEPGHRRRAVEVGDDPAHAVVRRGGDRDELGRRVEARLAQRADDVGEQQPGRPRACRGRRSARPLSVIFDQIARATSSRGASSSTKRSPSASSSVAPSPRIASVTRKPSRPLTPVTAVGWNCMSSRSASAAPAPRASSRPMPSEPGGFVVRCHSAAEPPVARITARAWMARPSSQTTPTQRPSRTHSVAARAPSMTVTPGRLDHDGGELAHDAPAGRAAAGVDDAPARVAALEAEREVAVAVGVEVHAEALEVAAPCAAPRGTGRSRRSCARGRARRARCPRGAGRASRRRASAAARPPCAQ